MSSNPILPIALSATLTLMKPIQVDIHKQFLKYSNCVIVNNSQPYYVINQVGTIQRPISFNSRQAFLQRINSFVFLENNWDGYNGESPALSAIVNATNFMNAIPELLLRYLSNENITPTPYGTIVFDFLNNEDLLSIEIGERQIGFFSDFKNKENKTLESAIFNQNKFPLELLEGFTNLYKKDFL